MKRRKGYHKAAVLYCAALFSICAGVLADDLETTPDMALNASLSLLFAFGFLDATPPTNTGPGNTANSFDFSAAYTAAVAAGKYTAVSTQTALNNAIAAATPGSFIRINAGTYSWSTVITCTGTSDSPIVIDGNDAVTINGATRPFDFSGASYVVVGRMTINASVQESVRWTNQSLWCRLTECSVTNAGTDAQGIGYLWIGKGSHYYQIDHNTLWTDGGRQGIQVYWDGTDLAAGRTLPYGGWIAYNELTGYTTQVAPVGIQIGVGEPFLYSSQGVTYAQYWANHDSSATIEYNYIHSCVQSGGEVVAFKADQNIFRYNYFKGNHGALTLRAGHTHQVYGNYFANNKRPSAGLVDVYDRAHTIINNIFVQDTTAYGVYMLMLWNASGTRYLGGSWTPVHTVTDCLVAHNTFVGTGAWANANATGQSCIRIGNGNVEYGYSGDPLTGGSVSLAGYPMHDNTIVNNIAHITGSSTSYMALTYVSTTGGGGGGGSSFACVPYNLTVSNNLYYSSGGAAYGLLYSGYDADPQEGSAGLDSAFSPTNPGPAVGTGYQIAVASDYYGLARSGIKDIGAVAVTGDSGGNSGFSRGQLRGHLRGHLRGEA